MSTTIYEGPEHFEKTLPEQWGFDIDITYSTVWFFEDRSDDANDLRDLRVATVPLAQLPAIYDAIGAYLDAVGRDFCTLPRNSGNPGGGPSRGEEPYG